ncbi:hypothetical protein H6F67_01470 [Microcoleus sp. FACHB-1515]|uniref:hypothetical protein n=1 Tax=Cyanophyceae TaxID=3028117 RepID=UPI00168404EB|nr:hypothetical protein [Microcoleus sp. FACHB-1515]MBD2088538.1 hypothetical protein [Microcoleus sp. FACHB-1515]
MNFRTVQLVAIALLLAGCNAPAPTATPEPESAASPAPTTANSTPTASASSPAPSPTAAAEQPAVISETGIGAAQLGMTIAQLRQTLGTSAEFVVQAPFMVDFDAIAVRQNGQIQYYILYLAGQQPNENLPIQGLLTTNPRYKTAAGVGVGVSIAQAESAYGKAILSYNTQNESREYARFEHQPADNISFGTGNGAQQTAGVYPAGNGEFRETQEYRSDAVIQSILVVCLAQGCAAQ